MRSRLSSAKIQQSSKVIRGQDLLGVVFTINQMALPLH